jgi:hypothetical protein
MSGMEFRAFADVHSPQPRPAADWERLHQVFERRLGAFGPIMAWNPDRPSDNAEVTISTPAAEPVDAGRMLTDAVYLALVAAGLGDCYVSRVELEVVATDSGTAAA